MLWVQSYCSGKHCPEKLFCCCALKRTGIVAALAPRKHLCAETSGKIHSFRKGRWSISGPLWSPLMFFWMNNCSWPIWEKSHGSGQNCSSTGVTASSVILDCGLQSWVNTRVVVTPLRASCTDPLENSQWLHVGNGIAAGTMNVNSIWMSIGKVWTKLLQGKWQIFPFLNHLKLDQAEKQGGLHKERSFWQL